MKILVAGATESMGLHVMKTANELGHQPVALVRKRRKVKLLPHGADIFYGDVSLPETLTDVTKGIDTVIFTLGADGQERISARVYCLRIISWLPARQPYLRAAVFRSGSLENVQKQ